MYLIIALFIGSIFIFDGYKRARRMSEWKRRWKDAQ